MIDPCTHATHKSSAPCAPLPIPETILNSLDETFVYLNTDMRVVWANRAACRLAKATRQEIGNRYCYQVWNSRLMPCYGCPVRKALETGRTEELTVQRGDGRDWLLKGYPVRAADGSVAGLVACMYDVTAHSQAEDNLKRSHRFLDIANRHTTLKSLLEAFGREIKNLTDCEVVRLCILNTEEKIVHESLLSGNALSFRSRQPACTEAGQCQCAQAEGCRKDLTPLAMAACRECPSDARERQPDDAVTPDALTRLFIPVRWGRTTMGIIHLEDPMGDKISDTLRQQLKSIAMQLGAAAQRIKAEEALRKAYITQEERVRQRTKQLTRINTKLRREIQEHEQAQAAIRLNEARLETLYQLTRMGDATLKEICDFVIENGVQLTQSEYGYLFFMNPEETVLTVHAWSNAARDICSVQGHPTVYRVSETGLWGEAVRQRQPIITNDYAAANPLKKGIPCGHVPLFRHMNIPVFEGDRIVAVAGVANKPSAYTDADVRQLQLLMDGMWRFIQQKRADEALRASEAKLRFLTSQLLDAQEKERKRIAIELHDELGQALLTLKLQISAIQKQIAASSPRITSGFGEILGNINAVTENVRRLSKDLSPSILEDLGLFAALRWLAEEVVKHYAFDVDWEMDDLFDGFSKPQEILVFRIFQEALTNVAKHAGARTVWISSIRKNGHIEMTIRDDGRGFDVDEILQSNANARGMGLAAMDERVRMLGGTLELDSRPGGGTSIRFELPVRDRRGQDHA